MWGRASQLPIEKTQPPIVPRQRHADGIAGSSNRDQWLIVNHGRNDDPQKKTRRRESDRDIRRAMRVLGVDICRSLFEASSYFVA